MRIANVKGRLAVVVKDQAHDVATVSDGRFDADPQLVYEMWDDFTQWADSADLGSGEPLRPSEIGSPAPRPRQLFAIGLNYADHAEESGYRIPEGMPPVFTKFASAITGPETTVELPPGGNTDWEVELVAVIGRTATGVSAAEAWDHVAGLTIGQDISERILQRSGPAPQFSLGKSFAGFAPMGPVLVSINEFMNADDIGLSCAINGEVVQDARTSQLIFPVPELIARLSAVITLFPGDVIFTGTPAGVGMGRTPQRWLQDGDIVTSRIEGIGTMTQRFVAPS